MIRRPGRDMQRLTGLLRAGRLRPGPRPMPVRDTSLEVLVAGWLSELGIPSIAQHRLIPGYAADFYVPSARLVIECHGGWFHADPRLVGARLTAAQRRKRQQDAAVARLLERAGMERLVLWEQDLRERPEWCFERLRDAVLRAGESAMSERVAWWTSPSGCVLAVHHGDLTAEPVDAIVNAANGQLAHGGGVAGAIVRRGGAVIQDESDAWVQQHGPVPTGGVALTGAGDLPCTAVIHAVGPVWHGGGQREPELLRRAVRAALELAAEQGYQSVALPAISSGIFGFPKPLCAEILVSEAEAFAAASSGGPVREIRFCNFDRPTVDTFVAEFERRYGPAPRG